MTDRQDAPRLTAATVAVLRALLEEPAREVYGLELCAAAGLPTGTVHPILARLEGMGWLESRWESVDPKAEGRPRRRYYRLSANGAARAQWAVARVTANQERLRARGARSGLAEGGAV